MTAPGLPTSMGRAPTLPEPSGTWEIAADSHTGMVRDRNEDGLAVVPCDAGAWALIVCDGMGGHSDGDRASAAAVGALSQHGPAPTDPAPYIALHRALVEANGVVAAAAAGSGAGTTAVVAWLTGPRVWVGWVGDSRLYQVRAGRILERTTDHTRVAKMVADGEIGEAEARDRPDAHVLLQALGFDGVAPSVWAEPLVVAPGDLIVLCSDGLYDLVEDAEIAEIVASFPPNDAVGHLIDLALSRGGHDNVTVAVARRVADTLDDARVADAPGGAPPRTAPTPAGTPQAGGPPTFVTDPDTAPFLPSRMLIAMAVALVFAIGLLIGLMVRGDVP